MDGGLMFGRYKNPALRKSMSRNADPKYFENRTKEKNNTYSLACLQAITLTLVINSMTVNNRICDMLIILKL